MGDKKVICKGLDRELFEAKVTIECLRTLLIQKGIFTESEIKDLIDSQLLAYKLANQEVNYVTTARWD